MKALLCGLCVDIRALPDDRTPVTCRCGNLTMWWTNPQRGRAQAFAQDRTAAFFLGLNNRFLVPAIQRRHMPPEEWRTLHETVTQADGFVFDRSMRACWAAVVAVGGTADVTFADTLPDEPQIEPSGPVSFDPSPT